MIVHNLDCKQVICDADNRDRLWTYDIFMAETLELEDYLERRKIEVIKTAVKSDKGMVMVFDEKGEQLPEYQGRYEEVRAKILAHAPKGAQFFHGGWPGNPVLRKDW